MVYFNNKDLVCSNKINSFTFVSVIDTLLKIYMNKRQIGLVVISSLLLTACLKAYEAPYTPNIIDPVFTISDIAGTYKPGKLKWEKSLIDTAYFKGVDDSASFMIYNYVDDSVFVNINTKTSITTKRYKLPLISRTEDLSSVTYTFSMQERLPNYYLYKLDYYLKVVLYYPSSGMASFATIINNSTKAQNPRTIFVEKVDFTALKQ